jgi:hypothetical protein
LDSVALVKDYDSFSSFSVPIVSAFVLFLVLEIIPGLMIDLLLTLWQKWRSKSMKLLLLIALNP